MLPDFPDANSLALAVMLATPAVIVAVPLAWMVFPGWGEVRQWFGFR
jgi:ABC-type Fe3+ transport system permease subunit